MNKTLVIAAAAAALSLTGAFRAIAALATDEHNVVPGLTAAGAALELHGKP